MNTLRSALCLLALITLARAHIPFPFGAIDIPLGEERTYYIVADVEEENATMYSFKSNTDPTVAEVKSPLNFPQKEFGSWTIKGLKLGTATLTFHWTYKKDRSGNMGDQDEVLVVNVVPPGTRTASNPWAISVADPVNSRSGGYESDDPVGLALGGPMPLGFAVDYDSQRVAEGIASGAMGANRRHNFEWKLEKELEYFGVETKPLAVKVTTDRGRVVRFSRRTTADKWTQVGRVDTVFGLMEEEGIFYFFTPGEQRVLVFDAAGKLTKIMDGRGNTHTLSYAGATLTGVADGLGRTLAFTTTSGRITRVTDHTGRHIDFAYSGVNMTTASDPNGHTTTFAYDGAGLLTSFTRPEGNTPFTQVFTAGKVTSQTERTTDTTMIAYAEGETTITQPGGATMMHRYSATGELTGFTDEGGNDLEMASDGTGRRNRVLDREGDATAITYHGPSGLPATITNAEGRVTTMTYKPRLLKLDGVTDKLKALTFYDLTKIVFVDGTSEAFTYDARGNMISRTDRAGKKWAATYNDRGQPLTMTNPTGGAVTLTYDAAGNLASSKDSATGATTFAYDTLNRLVTITRPGPAMRTFVYDDADRLTSTTDERGKTTAFDYDDNDRLTEVTDPDTNKTEFIHDTLDRVTQITDRLMKVSSRTFDARRLLKTVTDRNTNVTTFDYDERQRPVKMTDPGGKEWTFGFDGEGQLTSAANPVDPPARLARNDLGRIVAVSNPLGQTDGNTRDAMQRITQMRDALGRAKTFAYDKRGDLVGVSEEGSGTAKYTRDALGNVTAITAPNGGVWKSSYTAEGRVQAMTDPLGNAWQRTYDTRGRLATMAFPDATTAAFTYDGASNVTRVLHSDAHDFVFTYDNLGRLASANDASVAGSGINFTYDAESRLTRSQQNGVNFDATYDDGGRLKTVSYNGGAVVVTYTYDTRNRLTGVSDNVSGATVGFTYDDAGRITGMTRANGVPSTFTHDPASRLTRIQHGAFLDSKYTRNAAGEIVSEDRTAPLLPGVVAVAETFAFDKAAQVSGAGFAHDPRGRRTAGAGHAFEWDDADRLTTLNATTLGYNALGEIITRTDAGATTRFFHHHAIAGSPIVAERAEGTMTVTRYYAHTPGGSLLYSIDAATNDATYYHADHLGSTLALTSEAGVVTDSYAYGPFGENEQHTGPSTQPFTWLGELGVRKEGAFFQMRARYYDPATASFLSRDPVPPRLDDVRSLNPYAYANQNPLRYIDPAGSIVVQKEGAKSGLGELGGWMVLILSLAPDAVDESSLDTLGAFTIIDAATGESRLPRSSSPSSSFSTPPPELAQMLNPTMPKRTGLDIVRKTAAKFGGVVHSSASRHFLEILPGEGGAGPRLPGGNKVGAGPRIAENDSPRPRDRVFSTYSFFDHVPLPSGPGVPLRPELRPEMDYGFQPNDGFIGPRLPLDETLIIILPGVGGDASAAKGGRGGSIQR